MLLQDLVDYLDEYLGIRNVPDACLNGLEVQCGRDITKVALAVDPAEQVFRQADRVGAQMVLLHHGMFWREPVAITGPHYRRIRFLIRQGIAVYAAHLPLDAHPEVGNNAVLARMIGLSALEPFAVHHGVPVGCMGVLPGIHREDLAERLAVALGVEPAMWSFGRETVCRVAVCSGKADSDLVEAWQRGCQMFVTGETSHTVFTLAQDMSINVLFLGHYGSETVGLKALGEHIESRLGLETVFIPHPTGL